MKRAALVLVALAAPAHADDTVAASAFNKATELEQQGKWAEACPLYQASYRADPQIGVLLHLAVCHEHIGKLASAYTEFSDAADLAKARHDPREQTARERAAALAPKLAKLYVAPPSKPIAGLVVTRDGADITALVGSNVPVDAGEHEIAATAPGFLPWSKKITVESQGSAAIDLPLLEKAPDVVHEGTLRISTQADAQITLDGTPVGANGRYEAKVRAAGHTLRVTAPGMRAYQSEVVVAENDMRAIDVPLEKEYVAPTIEQLPAYEAGLSIAAGAKLRGDDPSLRALRGEFAFRFGRYASLGVFAEYGAIDTSNACGFSMAGTIATTPFDYGPRNQFQSCTYFMPGLQLLVHVLPKRAFDPYIGIAPAFRIGFASWVPYTFTTKGGETSDTFPAVVGSVRAGLDYHPTPQVFGWEVGAYLEASITIFGKEAADLHDGSNNMNGGESFLSVLGGIRSTYQF